MRTINKLRNGGLAPALTIVLTCVILAGCMSSYEALQASPSALQETTDMEARGQASYSPAETDRSTPVRMNDSVLIIEEPSLILKPEVREFSLSPELERELQEKKRPLQGLFKTTLETDKADGKINIRFTIRNVSGKDLRITYGSGQQYDIWILNETNEEVYRWSLNKAFTEALIVREFNYSDRIEYEEDWNLLDREGNPVPPGSYSIVVKVLVGLTEGTILQDELTARDEVEI